MKKISIQFHATPEELFDFLNSLRNVLEFSLGVIGWNPFSLMLVNRDVDFNFKDLTIIERKDFLRIVMSSKESLLHANSENHFYDKNPGCVTIDIGDLTVNSLKESVLSFMSSNEEEILFASKIASNLKKHTSVGAVAVNPDTGAEAKIGAHRYTQGAKYLYDCGVKMLPMAGKAYLKLEKPAKQ